MIDRIVELGRGVPSAATAAWALAGLRIFTGVIWLANEAWKLPPDFGRDETGGLMDNFLIAEQDAVFGFLRTFMSDVVIPNYTLFGWLVFLVELAAGVLLTLGLLTRLGALIGGIQALIITLLVVQAPTEWFWTYAMLIALHVVLFFTPCAERLALDSRAAAAPMRISVVVPTLAEAATVAEAVGAARRTLGDCEVIVVDGGSADGTAEAAEAAGATVLQATGSRAEAMNAGAARASGAALLFLHADTILPRVRVTRSARRWRVPTAARSGSASTSGRRCGACSPPATRGRAAPPTATRPSSSLEPRSTGSAGTARCRSWRTTTSSSASGVRVASSSCRSPCESRPGGTAGRASSVPSCASGRSRSSTGSAFRPTGSRAPTRLPAERRRTRSVGSSW